MMDDGIIKKSLCGLPACDLGHRPYVVRNLRYLCISHPILNEVVPNWNKLV